MNSKQRIIANARARAAWADVPPVYVSPREYRELVMRIVAVDQAAGAMTIDWTRECGQVWPLQPCEVPDVA